MVFTLLSPPHSITAQLNDDGWTSTLSGASAQHAIENTAGVRAKGVYLQDCWPHVACATYAPRPSEDGPRRRSGERRALRSEPASSATDEKRGRPQRDCARQEEERE